LSKETEVQNFTSPATFSRRRGFEVSLGEKRLEVPIRREGERDFRFVLGRLEFSLGRWGRLEVPIQTTKGRGDLWFVVLEGEDLNAVLGKKT